MIIRYSDGSYVEGVMHRLEGSTVRALVAGVDDAVEYRLIHNQWTAETGVVVTFEFPVEKMGGDLLQILPAMMGEGVPRCAAGGDCVLRRMSGSTAGPVN